MIIVNGWMFVTAAGTIFAGGAAMGAGCAEPTPFEPLTCGMGIAGGAPTVAGGVLLLRQAAQFFKNYTLPAIKGGVCGG